MEVHSKGWVIRQLKHCRVGSRIVELRLKVRKLYCLKCHKVSRQRIANVLPRKHCTEVFRREVFEQHVAGITQVHLSRTHKISPSTVERWLWDFLRYRVHELSGRSCPKILGIDEHFFSRKKGYATSLVDLTST
jgi:transposase